MSGEVLKQIKSVIYHPTSSQRCNSRGNDRKKTTMCSPARIDMCVIWVILMILPVPSSAQCSNCVESKCKTSGECLEGCLPGFADIRCQRKCPPNCINNTCHLDRQRGTYVCSDGCQDGYCGSGCKLTCQNGCTTCDRASCSVCDVKPCVGDNYGKKCTPCPENFEKCDKDTGKCIKCKKGFYGESCESICPTCLSRNQEIQQGCQTGCDVCPEGVRGHGIGLIVTAAVLSICILTMMAFFLMKMRKQHKYHGLLTKGNGMISPWCYIINVVIAVILATNFSSAQACPHGRYGEICDLICPANCEVLNPRKSFPGPCNKTTGHCAEGCKPGFHSSTCNETCVDHCKTCYQEKGECIICIDGNAPNNNRCILKEGLHVNESYTACSSNCLSNRCDTSGRCTHGCKDGFYGRKCDVNCNNACTSVICQQSNGRCVYGCIDGYQQTDNGCDLGGLDILINISSTIALGLLCSLTMILILMIMRNHHKRSRAFEKELLRTQQKFLNIQDKHKDECVNRTSRKLANVQEKNIDEAEDMTPLSRKFTNIQEKHIVKAECVNPQLIDVKDKQLDQAECVTFLEKTLQYQIV